MTEAKKLLQANGIESVKIDQSLAAAINIQKWMKENSHQTKMVNIVLGCRTMETYSIQLEREAREAGLPEIEALAKKLSSLFDIVEKMFFYRDTLDENGINKGEQIGYDLVDNNWETAQKIIGFPADKEKILQDFYPVVHSKRGQVTSQKLGII